MAEGMRGGDPVAMRTLAGKFNSEATTLQGLITRLGSETGGSNQIWVGPAAERFRTDWAGFKPTLDKLVLALQDAGKAVNANAQNIESATAVGK